MLVLETPSRVVSPHAGMRSFRLQRSSASQMIFSAQDDRFIETAVDLASL